MTTARPNLERDSRLMEEAIELAESALGFTSPNPAVGCVIVAGGQIVGREKRWRRSCAGSMP